MSEEKPRHVELPSPEEALRASRAAGAADLKGRIYTVPVYALDAAFWFFLEVTPIEFIRINRSVITLGSVAYHVELRPRGRNVIRIATIYMRAISSDVSRIDIIPHPDLEAQDEEEQKTLLGLVILQQRTFNIWRQREYNNAMEIARSMHEQEPPVEPDALARAIVAAGKFIQSHAPKTPGRTPDPDNEWARRELELGASRDEVLAGYMRRQNVDTSNTRAVNQARERFKKATAGYGSRQKGRK